MAVHGVGVELPACQAREQETKTEKKIEEKLAAQQAQRKKRDEEKQKKQQKKDAEQKEKEEKAAQEAANGGDKPDGSDAAAGNRRRRKRHTGDEMQATDPLVLRESCNFDAATYDFDKCTDVNEFAKAVATAPLVPRICRLKRGMLKKVLQAGCLYHES